MPARMRMQSCGTAAMASCPEPSDVVQDMSDQKTPPDDEGKDRGHGNSRSRGFVSTRLPPAHPVRQQECQPDRDEMLLEVEQAERRPLAGALQLGSDVDAEVQVHDPAQQCRDSVQNDDGVSE